MNTVNPPTHAADQSTGFDDKPVLRGMARPALVSAVLFMAVAGLIYPLCTTGVAQLLFAGRANGSLIERNGVVVGSALVGQDFTQAKYFHPRPSATQGTDPAHPNQSIAQPYNAAASAGSNFGPTSKKLIDQVGDLSRAYRAENGLSPGASVPVDAVTASASGLDPDISLANSLAQAGRVARIRHLPEQRVLTLIKQHTTPPQLGLLGDPRVNVLSLNLTLDTLATGQPTGQPTSSTQ